MANFVLIIVFVGFQISRGEDASEIGKLNAAVDDLVLSFPTVDYKEFVGPSHENKQERSEEEWTKEDEEWFQENQDLLAEDSDEDWEYAEVDKLIEEIEKLINEYYPEKGDYTWLQEIENFFTSSYDDDNDSDKELDGKADDRVYMWMYRRNAGNIKNYQSFLKKRFSSV